MNGDIYPYKTYFYNVTGVTDYYNILRTSQPEEYNYYLPFINADSTRAAIHVGNLSYGAHARDVEIHLINVWVSLLVAEIFLYYYAITCRIS